MLNEDQHFLLVFIMGTYFAPDLRAEIPRKPAFQRLSERLPPYSSEELVKTRMKILTAEQAYYHVLRRADKSLIVKLPTFRDFFKGVLNIPYDPNSDQRQFPDLFPTHLHPHDRFRDRYKFIESIVFINNPNISYIKVEDVERFKRLTGLENFVLDKTEVGKVVVGAFIKETKPECFRSVSQRAVPCSDIASSSGESSRRRKRSTEMHVRPPLVKSKPVILMLPNTPTDEEWSNLVAATKNSVELSGTIAERPAGSLAGLVDFGVCEESYFFQVSLPGVGWKENDKFQCTVNNDGRVSIKGQTKTGRKYFFKNQRTYEMQTQNLCPPGPFTVSFQLPGPVNASKLDARFEDGILEGVVLKNATAELNGAIYRRKLKLGLYAKLIGLLMSWKKKKLVHYIYNCCTYGDENKEAIDSEEDKAG